MTYFFILVFYINGEMYHGIVTKSEQACSDLMEQHLHYAGDLSCEATDHPSGSIRPKPRPTK